MNQLVESNATRGARRRARTRAAILDAGERTFTESGYRGAKMEDVAEQADVAVGSIYSHFGNKDGLYLAVVERAVELFHRYMQQAYQPDWTPLEQVMACGDAYLRFHIAHPGAFRFLAFDDLTEDAVIDPAMQARIAAGIDAIMGEFTARIQAAVDTGEARPLDARLTGRFLWGAWNGTVALGLRRDGLALTEPEIEATIQQAREIVVAGLCHPSARDEHGEVRARLHRTEPPDPD